MQQLLCFAGLPGVGKSTLSHAVSNTTGATIVDIDDFKKTHVDPTLVTTQIDPPEQRWAYYRDSIEHAFTLFEDGVGIAILDEVFHLHELRSRVEELCRARGVQVIWVEIHCAHDIIAERLASKGREGHILSTEEALRMNLLFKDIFEPFPTSTQNHVLIRNDGMCDVPSMTNEILRKMEN